MKRGGILFTIAFILCASACSDNGAPDPCDGANDVVARFKIEEIVDTIPRESDIAVTGMPVRFTALERYDKYEWHIGSDDRVFTDSSFELSFRASEFSVGEPLPIVFIGKRAPLGSCNPSDDGVDTLTKSLTLFTRFTSPILGEYRGTTLDAPLDSFDVHLFWRDESFLIMTNINRGCADTIVSTTAVSDKRLGATIMTFDAHGLYDGGGCEAPEGEIL